MTLVDEFFDVVSIIAEWSRKRYDLNISAVFSKGCFDCICKFDDVFFEFFVDSVGTRTEVLV